MYFKVGLLLPDLVAGFNQKLRRNVFSHAPAQQEHRDLLEGIQKHYAVDRVFHQCEEFRFFCGLIGEALRSEEFPAFQHRKYFMAHIFTEMLIDRLLVEHSPYLCVKIKNDLEETDAGVLKSYFLHIEKPVIQKEFFDNFKRLLIGKPLLFYSDNEMFVMALVRVFKKINPASVSRPEAESLMRLTEKVETEYREPLLGIFETVNESLATFA